MFKSKWLFVVIALLVVAGMIWSLTQPDAVVTVITPQRQTVRAYIEEQAITELPFDHLISMPIDGWLEPIRLREGDEVEAGAVIARLQTEDLRDRVRQVEQRIAELETRIRETTDHRLEENALVEVEATVKAIDETVAAAEAQLEGARATLDFTQSELARLRNLSEAGTASDREMREAELAYRKAHADLLSDQLDLAALKTVAAVSYIGPKFIRDYIDRKKFTVELVQRQLEQAQADLAIAKRNLERADIVSPIDGVVLRRHQTRHQFLPAGTPLLTLGQLDKLEVVAEILTQQATRIQPGDPVEIYGEAVSGQARSGQVLRVYPAGFEKISSLGVEQQRVNVAIRFDQPPERLGVDFRVYVRVFYDQAPDALTVPRTALLRSEDGGWQVMLVRDNRIHPQDVQVGILNDDLAQISAGLDLDARVVDRPADDLGPGAHVKTRGDS